MKVTSRIASAARGVPAPSLHHRNGVEGSRLASSWKLSLRTETSVAIHIYRCIHTDLWWRSLEVLWHSVRIRMNFVPLIFWMFYCVLWHCCGHFIFLTNFNGIFPKSGLFILHVHLKKSPLKMFGTGWALQIKTWKLIGRTLFHASGDAGRSWSSSKWIWGNSSSCFSTLFFRTICLSFHPDLHVGLESHEIICVWNKNIF